MSLNGDAGLVALEAPSLLPPVIGVRQRFVLAIINLLRNAIQSVAGRRPEIRVSVQIRDKDLWVTVDDNGPGVPADQRGVIFAEGYTTRPGGMGQGLSLVREVVGELQGEVHCQESPAGGARFLIRLRGLKGG